MNYCIEKEKASIERYAGVSYCLLTKEPSRMTIWRTHAAKSPRGAGRDFRGRSSASARSLKAVLTQVSIVSAMSSPIRPKASMVFVVKH